MLETKMLTLEQMDYLSTLKGFGITDPLVYSVFYDGNGDIVKNFINKPEDFVVAWPIFSKEVAEEVKDLICATSVRRFSVDDPELAGIIEKQNLYIERTETAKRIAEIDFNVSISFLLDPEDEITYDDRTEVAKDFKPLNKEQLSKYPNLYYIQPSELCEEDLAFYFTDKLGVPVELAQDLDCNDSAVIVGGITEDQANELCELTNTLYCIANSSTANSAMISVLRRYYVNTVTELDALIEEIEK
jgi:hypothetical protein